MAAVGLGGRAPLFAVGRFNRIAESAPVRSTRREPDPVEREAVTLETVRVAAELCVDVNTANAVAARGYDTVIAYLVGQGARLDLTNQDNQTPLDLARASRAGDSTVALLQRLGPGQKQVGHFWASRRPPGQARGARIPGVCKRRATQSGGMHRRSEWLTCSCPGPKGQTSDGLLTDAICWTGNPRNAGDQPRAHPRAR